jgi:hypothetical protein
VTGLFNGKAGSSSINILADEFFGDLLKLVVGGTVRSHPLCGKNALEK